MTSPGEPGLAELDALLAAGTISLGDYWRARVGIERRQEVADRDGAYDLREDAPGEPHGEGWIPPPPGRPRPPGPDAPPPPMVAPPPPPRPGPPVWVRLQVPAPGAEAESTRAHDRPRRRRIRRRR